MKNVQRGANTKGINSDALRSRTTFFNRKRIKIIMTRPTLLFFFCAIAITLLYSCEARKCRGGPNDVRTDCGSHCPRTCERPNPGTCILSCKINTCECRAGYYRRRDGRCVTKRGCKHRPRPTWTWMGLRHH